MEEHIKFLGDRFDELVTEFRKEFPDASAYEFFSTFLSVVFAESLTNCKEERREGIAEAYSKLPGLVLEQIKLNPPHKQEGK